MNWHEVRKHNARASARKARRERLAAERKAKVERAGGPITVAELKSATRRVEPPAHSGYGHDRHVWTFRGTDWVLGYSDGETWQAFAPFRPWRQDPDHRELVPMTPGAKKWLAAALAREQTPEPKE
jgi:hypothetical protein